MCIAMTHWILVPSSTWSALTTRVCHGLVITWPFYVGSVIVNSILSHSHPVTHVVLIFLARVTLPLSLNAHLTKLLSTHHFTEEHSQNAEKCIDRSHTNIVPKWFFSYLGNHIHTLEKITKSLQNRVFFSTVTWNTAW